MEGAYHIAGSVSDARSRCGEKVEGAHALNHGKKTLNPLRMIIEELSRLMPAAERVTIPGATHDMWLEEPEACGKATLSFLARH